MGLGVNGLALVAFLAVAGNALPKDEYSLVVAFWSALYALGNGVMQPLEQEVARAVSARRANGLGPGPVVRRAAAVGAAFTLVLCLVALIGHSFLLDRYFKGNVWVEVAFIIGLCGFALAHLARGTLSSHGRFSAYALFFSVEGLSRLVGGLVLVALAVRSAEAFALLLALAPFAAVAVAVSRQRGLLEEGPPAEWAELTRALGWLLLGIASLSLLLQASTMAVNLLAGDSDAQAAGQLGTALLIARTPLFLFQAVLASLLPRLSHLAAEGRYREFAANLRRLVAAIAGAGALAVVVSAALGPWILEKVFNSGGLGARDLAMLAGASVLLMIAVTFDQALIALSGHSRMAIGWLVALLTFVAVTAAGRDLFLRVELGLLAGAAVAVVWMYAWLIERLRHHAHAEEVDLAEAAAEIPLQ